MSTESTPQPVTIGQYDTDDVIIVRIDAKDPDRRQIVSGIQYALETVHRNEEATRLKAYAQEKMPDDWKRKKSEKPEERTIRQPEK